MNIETTLVDDDGVLVIASPAALKRRYANRSFEYTFPKALLEGMRARELFAWQSGFEGEHKVSVQIVTDAAFGDAPSGDSTDESRLALRDGQLLVVPYSQFTFGCDNGGRFEERDGLATIVTVPTDTYRVCVVRVGHSDDGCAFRVLLTPALSEDHVRTIDAIPGWMD